MKIECTPNELKELIKEIPPSETPLSDMLSKFLAISPQAEKERLTVPKC